MAGTCTFSTSRGIDLGFTSYERNPEGLSFGRRGLWTVGYQWKSTEHDKVLGIYYLTGKG
jgi:hypothetical protein